MFGIFAKKKKCFPVKELLISQLIAHLQNKPTEMCTNITKSEYCFHQALNTEVKMTNANSDHRMRNCAPNAAFSP